MAAIVTYDGQQPWGVYPPFASIEVTPVSFGQNWYESRTIQLQGQLTEKMITDLGIGGGLEGAKTAIVAAFSANDKIFKIVSGSTVEIKNVFVDAISFTPQRWQGLLAYSITLTAYNFHYCEDPTEVGNACDGGQPAILNPSDQFDAQMGDDGNVSLTHTASAKGMDGFVNQDVIDWVNARIAALDLSTYDSAVPGWHLENYEYHLVSEEEQVNRFQGTYSKVRKYLIPSHPACANACPEKPTPLVRYTATVNQGVTQDYPVVSVNGSVTAGRDTYSNFSQLADQAKISLSESELRDVAGRMLSAAGFTETLAEKYNNYNLDQDEQSYTVRAKATFEARPIVSETGFFDHEISIDIDWVTGLCKVSVDGEIECKGCLSAKNECIDAFLAANTDVRGFLFGYANSAYSAVASNLWSVPNAQALRSDAIDLQITKNEKKGTLRLSASYDDEREEAGVVNESWDVTAKTSIPYTKSNPSGQPGTNGYWSIQSFNFSTRWKLAASISLGFREDTAVLEANREAAVRSNLNLKKNAMFNQYGGGVGYTVSQSDNIGIGATTSGSMSEERSYPATLPLIDINLASLLTPPQPR